MGAPEVPEPPNKFDFEDESITTLLPQARAGVASARSELFEQLHSFLAWVARNEVNPQLRQKCGESDFVQMSYVQAVEHFDRFRGDNQNELKAWLREILQNEIRQVERSFRTAKRDYRKERHLDFNLNDQSKEMNFQPQDSLPTPGTAAINQEQTSSVLAAIERLPEDYQTVIKLRNWQKCSFADIGQQMQRSENAVTKLWFRALERLQQEIEKGQDE